MKHLSQKLKVIREGGCWCIRDVNDDSLVALFPGGEGEANARFFLACHSILTAFSKQDVSEKETKKRVIK